MNTFRKSINYVRRQIRHNMLRFMTIDNDDASHFDSMSIKHINDQNELNDIFKHKSVQELIIDLHYTSKYANESLYIETLRDHLQTRNTNELNESYRFQMMKMIMHAHYKHKYHSKYMMHHLMHKTEFMSIIMHIHIFLCVLLFACTLTLFYAIAVLWYNVFIVLFGASLIGLVYQGYLFLKH